MGGRISLEPGKGCSFGKGDCLIECVDTGRETPTAKTSE